MRRCGIIGGTLDAVDKLIKKLSPPNVELRLVYEAGPCGFVLCRYLRHKGMVCQIVAPSLIPKKASDRVKTDLRDADQLVRLYRAGELTARAHASPLNNLSLIASHLQPSATRSGIWGDHELNQIHGKRRRREDQPN